VSDIKVAGQGCSISQSSASMMSQAVKGKPVADAQALFHRFKALMGVEHAGGDGDGGDSDSGLSDDEIRSLGDLAALQGVVKFPVRIKCATLAWNTMAQALATSPDA
jgi:nitrogen fixation NifU-like protein